MGRPVEGGGGASQATACWFRWPMPPWSGRHNWPDRTLPAGRVRERAAAAMEPFPGEPEEELADRFAAMPCPAPDPDDGPCGLYAWRPISCRTFGPPVRFGVDDPPPCRPCFTGAGPEEVERCRVGVDPDGLEEALLDEAGAPETLETRVMFAPASRHCV